MYPQILSFNCPSVYPVMSYSSSLIRADLSMPLLPDVLIAPVWCPITSRKLCLWLSINLLHKSLQPGLLVRRQHPIGWTAVRRNRDEWQLTGKKWGQCCCWIVWRTTDKLTTFIHHTRLGARKWNWANHSFVWDELIYWGDCGGEKNVYVTLRYLSAFFSTSTKCGEKKLNVSLCAPLHVYFCLLHFRV